MVKSEVFGEVLHRQIAGALAKRIVNYATTGQEVSQSSDSGFIKFGSRVDIFLPLDTKINVKNTINNFLILFILIFYIPNNYKSNNCKN